MDNVYFGTYEGEFKEEAHGVRFKVFAVTSEGGNIINVLLPKCQVLINKDNHLLFKYGIRHYDFLFKNHMQGIEKVTYTPKLFGWLPLFSFRGEIGSKFKHEFLEMFKTTVNNPLQSTTSSGD